MERDMRNVPGFTNVTASTSLLQPELTIRPRADRAAELGVTTSAISQATRIATSGDITNNLSKLNLPDRQIPIRVRLNDAARADIDQIRLLQVPSRAGPVPLDERRGYQPWRGSFADHAQQPQPQHHASRRTAAPLRWAMPRIS